MEVRQLGYCQSSISLCLVYGILYGISRDLFSSYAVILYIGLCSCVAFLVLIHCAIHGVLREVRDLSSLAGRSSRVLSARVCAGYAILVSLDLGLGFRIRNFRYVLRRVFCYFSYLELGFCGFYLFLGFLFCFFFCDFFGDDLLEFVHFLFYDYFLELGYFGLL